MGDFYKGRGGGGYRGGYRGSRRGSGEWRGSGGRGFSSSRGDRGGSNRYFSNSSQSSYESRSRSTYGNVPSDKFSRPRNDDYHGSSSSYSREVEYGRDDHRRQSPEPPRKRGRPDSSPSYMGSRRSHERSYSSGEYQGRSYVDKSGPGGGYLTEKGSYREVRESKPDYAFRKPAYSPRVSRGSFRGRASIRSWRGATRGRGFKGTTSYLARKRMETIGVRKRMSGRTDYIRRLATYRKQRFNRDGDEGEKKSDDEEDEEEDDEEMGEEEEEEIEEVVDGDEEEGEEEMEDEEMEEKEGDLDEGEGEEEEKVAVQEEKELTDGEKKEEDVSTGDKKKDTDTSPKKKVVKKKVVTKKVVKKAVATKKTKEASKEVGKDDEEEEEGEKEEGEDEEEDDEKRTNSRGQPFIRLKCPHCAYVCVTFNEYSRHLTTKKHSFAMRALSNKLRVKLTAMRVNQRKKQRILDDEAKANNLKLKTFFCQVCKLNYRTLKSDHFQSPEHKKIREFLAPYCKVCKLSFKSPWAYENHISELLHIKRKGKTFDKSRKLEEKDIDLDPSSFMVLDSVGSGDEDEETDKSEGEEIKEGETVKEGDASPEKKKKKKEEIKLGAEHCKLVEVYFCELCKIYLPRAEDKEKGLAYHCRSRTHLERYVRHRDDQTLRRRAVKLHKALEKEKEKEKEKVKEIEKKVTKEEGDTKKEDDKSWSEVDKDLSDLLHDEEATVEGAAEGADDQDAADDDEDSRQEGERYDRFKQSEKVDKEGGKTPAAQNGSLSTDEIKTIDPSTDEK